MGFHVFGDWLGHGFGRVFGSVPAISAVLIVNDEFLNQAAAPLASPRNCEPGPGQLVMSDTSNRWSIPSPGGELVPGGMSVGNNNPGAWLATAQARVGGRALKCRIKNISAFGSDANKTQSPMVIWSDSVGSTTTTDYEGVVYWVANTKFQLLDSISATFWVTLKACLADTYNVIVTILRSGGGMFHVVDGELIGITRQNTDGSVFPDVGAFGANRNPPQVDYIKVGDLGTPWDTDFGICTNQLPGARAVNDAFTHETDAHLEFTITALPSAGNVFIQFRKQDANNHWRVNINTAGTVTLQEVVAGTPSTRATLSGCLVNDRIVVSFKGASISAFQDRPATGVANATAYNSALFPSFTTGLVSSLGTGGGIKDLYTYPYTLSGAALAAINNMVG